MKKQIAEASSQLTLEQQVAILLDAKEYYQECVCDGMNRVEAQAATEAYHLNRLTAMVNDKVLTELGL